MTSQIRDQAIGMASVLSAHLLLLEAHRIAKVTAPIRSPNCMKPQ